MSTKLFLFIVVSLSFFGLSHSGFVEEVITNFLQVLKDYYDEKEFLVFSLGEKSDRRIISIRLNINSFSSLQSVLSEDFGRQIDKICVDKDCERVLVASNFHTWKALYKTISQLYVVLGNPIKKYEPWVAIDLGTRRWEVMVCESNMCQSPEVSEQGDSCIAFADEENPYPFLPKKLVSNSDFFHVFWNDVKPFLGTGELHPKRKEYLTKYPHYSFISINGKLFVQDENTSLVISADEVVRAIFRNVVELLSSRFSNLASNTLILVPNTYTQKQLETIAEVAAEYFPDNVSFIKESLAGLLGLRASSKKILDGCFGTIDGGGGTFDISTVCFDKGTISSDFFHDGALFGGNDMTQCLMNEAMKSIPESERKEYISNSKTFMAFEEAKEQLSEPHLAEREYKVTLFAGEKTKQVAVSRKLFDTACGPMIKLALEPVLKRSLENLQKCDKLYFTGGATLVPMVSKFIGETIGKHPEIVPRAYQKKLLVTGAALEAYERQYGKSLIKKHDTLALPITTIKCNGSISEYCQRISKTIFAAGTNVNKLSYSGTHNFHKSVNCEECTAEFRIFEGDATTDSAVLLVDLPFAVNRDDQWRKSITIQPSGESIAKVEVRIRTGNESWERWKTVAEKPFFYPFDANWNKFGMTTGIVTNPELRIEEKSEL